MFYPSDTLGNIWGTPRKDVETSAGVPRTDVETAAGTSRIDLETSARVPRTDLETSAGTARTGLETSGLPLGHTWKYLRDPSDRPRNICVDPTDRLVNI